MTNRETDRVTLRERKRSCSHCHNTTDLPLSRWRPTWPHTAHAVPWTWRCRHTPQMGASINIWDTAPNSCTNWMKPEPASCQTHDPDRRFPVENCGLQSRIDHRPPTTHVSPHPTPHLRSQHVGSHEPPPQDHSGLLCAPPVNVSTMVGNRHSDPVSRPVSADSCRSRFRL